MSTHRNTSVLGALALAGSLLAAVAAVPAQAATPSPASTPAGDGAKAICKRLPKTEERVTKALTRLGGDATVVGSVARLQQRAADAKAAGHTEIEKLLNDRLTARKALVTTLQTRQNDLRSVATWCAGHDQGASK
ncbi:MULTISPECIES: hypothetical protein [Streptomyces]|uniref:hypothetical protein n=1 Tax=Streptomyces TaxID=1883 RepID=UPI0004AAB581|nr:MULTISPECIES: hypothetical protein [Streptomyces]